MLGLAGASGVTMGKAVSICTDHKAVASRHSRKDAAKDGGGRSKDPIPTISDRAVSDVRPGRPRIKMTFITCITRGKY